MPVKYTVYEGDKMAVLESPILVELSGKAIIRIRVVSRLGRRLAAFMIPFSPLKILCSRHAGNKGIISQNAFYRYMVLDPTSGATRNPSDENFTTTRPAKMAFRLKEI